MKDSLSAGLVLLGLLLGVFVGFLIQRGIGMIIGGGIGLVIGGVLVDLYRRRKSRVQEATGELNKAVRMDVSVEEFRTEIAKAQQRDTHPR